MKGAKVKDSDWFILELFVTGNTRNIGFMMNLSINRKLLDKVKADGSESVVKQISQLKVL